MEKSELLMSSIACSVAWHHSRVQASTIFDVKSISFSGSLVNLGYFLAVVNTFNGALNINYLCNEPLIDRDRALALSETARAFLRGSVD